MLNLKSKMLAIVGATSVLSTSAFAAVDYTPLTSAVDFTAIVAVLLSVAALVVGFVLVKNNIGIIKRFISSNAK